MLRGIRRQTVVVLTRCVQTAAPATGRRILAAGPRPRANLQMAAAISFLILEKQLLTSSRAHRRPSRLRQPQSHHHQSLRHPARRSSHSKDDHVTCKQEKATRKKCVKAFQNPHRLKLGSFCDRLVERNTLVFSARLKVRQSTGLCASSANMPINAQKSSRH